MGYKQQEFEWVDGDQPILVCHKTANCHLQSRECKGGHPLCGLSLRSHGCGHRRIWSPAGTVAVWDSVKKQEWELGWGWR